MRHNIIIFFIINKVTQQIFHCVSVCRTHSVVALSAVVQWCCSLAV